MLALIKRDAIHPKGGTASLCGRLTSHPKGHIARLEQLESRALLDASPAVSFFTTAAQTTAGLTGSYVNQSLRFYAPQDDWRTTQTIAGTRVDADIDFVGTSWGRRSTVGLTFGSDANWENFSVQWDGFIKVDQPTRVWTFSDDGSRMWIDLNGDNAFNSTFPEVVSNNWGSGQIAQNGVASTLLNPGLYRIRIQYEEFDGANIMQVVGDGPHVVRIAYLVPSNRTAQTHAVATLQNSLRWFQEFYRDQMERNGFGPKAFSFETEADGVTPKIHVVNGPNTDDFYRVDPFGRVTEALNNAGLSVGGSKEVWLQYYEGHVQLPDGSVEGSFFGGLSFGSGSDAGRALVGSDALAFMSPNFLTNNASYEGHVEPNLGPYPMHFSPGNVPPFTFVDFIGSTFSQISSSFQGGSLHELSHAFGLPHDFRNDANFHGNLMGNGHRGFRGWLYPELYPQDDMRLEYGSALALSTSRYFNPGRAVIENNKPSAGLSVSGNATPVAGLLEIPFTAFDASGVAAALFFREGELIGELPLSGTSASGVFKTPFYTPGLGQRFSMALYDTQGNRGEISTFITPATGRNRAPIPFMKVSPSAVGVGETVVLDASFSSDPDGNNPLKYEWDLNGDGIFDTAPTTGPTFATSFATAGTRIIRVRVSDSLGASSISAPIGIRIGTGGPPPTQPQLLISVNGDGTLVNSDGSKLTVSDSDVVEFSTSAGGAYRYSLYFDGSDVGLTTTDEDVDAFDLLSDGSLIISTEGPVSVRTNYSGGAGSGPTINAGREDLLKFTPTSIGSTTAGTWSVFLDGSQFGLSSTRDENIDAVALLADGRIVVSAQGNFSAPGASGTHADLFALDRATGKWSIYFDASDVGLTTSDENIDALAIQEQSSGLPSLMFSTRGDFAISGQSGKDDDVFTFNASRIGGTTAGTFAATLLIDGSTVGLSAFDIDGLHLATLGVQSLEPSTAHVVSGAPASSSQRANPALASSATRSVWALFEHSQSTTTQTNGTGGHRDAVQTPLAALERSPVHRVLEGNSQASSRQPFTRRSSAANTWIDDVHRKIFGELGVLEPTYAQLEL